MFHQSKEATRLHVETLRPKHSTAVFIAAVVIRSVEAQRPSGRIGRSVGGVHFEFLVEGVAAIGINEHLS